MQVLEAIREKRAVRQFEDRPIPEADVTAILDAGRRAQSAMNTQPWHFVAVRDRKILDALAEAPGYANHLKTAALGVMLLVPQAPWSAFDGGQAASYMQLAGWERGIASCLGAFTEQEPVRRILGFPADLHLLIAISFGYEPPEAAHPPRKGGRRPLEEVVHWDRW